MYRYYAIRKFIHSKFPLFSPLPVIVSYLLILSTVELKGPQVTKIKEQFLTFNEEDIHALQVTTIFPFFDKIEF
jgi:hypothetical protein